MHKKEINQERYARQVQLPELGIEGQQKMAAARVLVVGAGGLGCPVLQYLAAAGVGALGIADGDVVSLSNLHRQTIYTHHDVGELKANAAATYLRRLNPEIRVKPYPFFISNVLALKLIEKYDIVVDGTDSFVTRYLINDACVLLQKPLVYAALSQWQGQVAVFNAALPDGSRSAHYRNLFPRPPQVGQVPNCAEAGVLGVLPAIVGAMQAAEVVKLITGIGEPLVNKVLHYDLKTCNSFTLQLQPSGEPIGPVSREAHLKTDYELLCGGGKVAEVEPRDLYTLVEQGWEILDVREPGELPVLPLPHRQWPLTLLRREKPGFEAGKNVVVICQSGISSQEAVRILGAQCCTGTAFYSLKGGINAWDNIPVKKEL